MKARTLFLVSAVIVLLCALVVVPVGWSASEYVSPSGFNDSSSAWSDETNAYDENTGSCAVSITWDGWLGFLELTLSETIACSRFRIFVGRESSQISMIDVDIYDVSASGWSGVYQGGFTVLDAWWTFNISTVNTNKMRIRAYCGIASYHLYVYEADLWALDEATFQKTIDARSPWWGLPTGRVSSFLRFYGYGDEKFTMTIERQSNSSDRIALYFNSSILYFWDRRNSSWLFVGSYPLNEWLEVALESGSYATFYIRDARTDVPIWEQDDLFGSSTWYDECYELSLARLGDGLSDLFDFALSFTSGSVAFDFVKAEWCQTLFYYPVHYAVEEEYDNDDFSNWDSCSVTCDVVYEVIGGNETMTIGKYWVSGDEPSNPEMEDINRPWWENIQAQMADKLHDIWDDMRAILSNLPYFGDFGAQLWSWFDFGLGFVGNIWSIIVDNLDLVLMVVVLGYGFSMLSSILSGRVESIKESFVKPIQDLVSVVSMAAGVLGTIWGFIKFW